MKFLICLFNILNFKKNEKDFIVSYGTNFGKIAISLFWEIGKSYTAFL